MAPNGTDKLYVDSSSTKQTDVWFQKGNGAAELKLCLYKTGVVDFAYTNEFGQTYETTKPAGDFQIANLVHDGEGKLKETTAKDGVNFALYRSAETEGSSVINVPALSLKLTLHFVDELTCAGKESIN